ncbi:MAG: hypothetical protein ACO3BE_11990 [Gemmobacter sp.]
MDQRGIGRRGFTAGIGAAALLGRAAGAAPAAEVFDDRWRHLVFRRIPPTEFRPEGTRLIVRSERGASVFWRVLGAAERGVARAAWRW